MLVRIDSEDCWLYIVYLACSHNDFSIFTACMAAPWLFGYGFSIVFSALFAKIYRVRMIVASAVSFRRTRVEAKDVMFIMVGILGVESLILLVWTLVDPLKWDREVILADEYGLTLISSGRCVSDNSLVFWLIFVAFNVFILLYALVLCYLTRTYPSEFAESRWITACVISYVQILLLAVPILAIVEGNNNVAFFGRAAIVFLMSMSASLLIFGPKVYSLHYEGGEPEEVLVTRSKVFNRMSAAVSQSRRDSGASPDGQVSGLNNNATDYSASARFDRSDRHAGAGVGINSWAMVGFESQHSQHLTRSSENSASFKVSNHLSIPSEDSTEPKTSSNTNGSSHKEADDEQVPAHEEAQSPAQEGEPPRKQVRIVEEKADDVITENSGSSSVNVWVDSSNRNSVEGDVDRSSTSSGAQL